MARGNETIVTANPRGVFKEGYVKASQTFQPGMVVEADPTVALVNGESTYQYATPGADGGIPKGAYWIVTNLLNSLQGKTNSDTYAAGTRVSVYCPLPGEEINLLLLDVAGTADDHTAGEILIVKNAVGKFIATTGSPAQKVAQLMETITDPVADTLAWCTWGQP